MRIWQTWKSEEDAVKAHEYFHRNIVMHIADDKIRVDRAIREIRPKQKVLDLGCNDGEFGKHLIDNLKCDVYGIDVSVVCEKFAKKNGVKFTRGRIEKMPYGDNEFDTAIAMEVLEHIWNTKKALAEIHRVIKLGGLLLGTVPHPAVELKDLSNQDHHCHRFTKKTLKYYLLNSFKTCSFEDLYIDIQNHNRSILPTFLFFKAYK